MTPNELILFKELLKEAVRDVIKEELGKVSYKKDLKEIKILVGGLIKENRKRSSGETLTEGTQNGLLNLINKKPLVPGRKQSIVPSKNPIMNILQQTAQDMTGGDVQNMMADTSNLVEGAGGDAYNVTDLYQEDAAPMNFEYEEDSYQPTTEMPDLGGFLKKMNESSKERAPQ